MNVGMRPYLRADAAVRIPIARGTEPLTIGRFGRVPMPAELSIIPLRSGLHISEEIAEALKLVDASGLPYQLTPSGTCIEGGWMDAPVPRLGHRKQKADLTRSSISRYACLTPFNGHGSFEA